MHNTLQVLILNTIYKLNDYTLKLKYYISLNHVFSPNLVLKPNFTLLEDWFLFFKLESLLT